VADAPVHAAPTTATHAAARRTRGPTAILSVAGYPVKAGCAFWGCAGWAGAGPPPPPPPPPPQDDWLGLGLAPKDGLLLPLPLGNGSGLLGLELGLGRSAGCAVAVPVGELLGLGNRDDEGDGLGDDEHDGDGDDAGVGGPKLMEELGDGFALESPFAATSVNAKARMPSNAKAIPSRFMVITSCVK